MITINLLPLSAGRLRASGRRFLKRWLAAAGLACLVLAAVWIFYLQAGLDRLSKREKAVNENLSRLELAADEALGQARDVAGNHRLASAVMELEERRRDQPRLLMELVSLLPDESWLLSLSHKDGQLSLEGAAVDHGAMALFLSRLEEARHLKNIRLVNATEDLVINQIKLVRFQIAAETVMPRSSLLTYGVPGAGLPPEAEIKKLLANMPAAN